MPVSTTAWNTGACSPSCICYWRVRSRIDMNTNGSFRELEWRNSLDLSISHGENGYFMFALFQKWYSLFFFLSFDGHIVGVISLSTAFWKKLSLCWVRTSAIMMPPMNFKVGWEVCRLLISMMKTYMYPACGILPLRSVKFKQADITWARFCRPFKKKCIQFQNDGWTSNEVSLFISIEWSTRSNALLKSINSELAGRLLNSVSWHRPKWMIFTMHCVGLRPAFKSTKLPAWYQTRGPQL